MLSLPGLAAVASQAHSIQYDQAWPIRCRLGPAHVAPMQITRTPRSYRVDGDRRQCRSSGQGRVLADWTRQATGRCRLDTTEAVDWLTRSEARTRRRVVIRMRLMRRLRWPRGLTWTSSRASRHAEEHTTGVRGSTHHHRLWLRHRPVTPHSLRAELLICMHTREQMHGPDTCVYLVLRSTPVRT